MKYFIVFFLSIFTFSWAQTKKISFKSHSGANVNFESALVNNSFDIGDSNMGDHPGMYKDRCKSIIDSVKFISKDKQVLISHTTCAENNYIQLENSPLENEIFYEKDTISSTLFGQKHLLDNLKSQLKNNEEYQNTVFENYDNDAKAHQKELRQEQLLDLKKQKEQKRKELQEIKRKEKELKKQKLAQIGFGSSFILLIFGLIFWMKKR